MVLMNHSMKPSVKEVVLANHSMKLSVKEVVLKFFGNIYKYVFSLILKMVKGKKNEDSDSVKWMKIAGIVGFFILAYLVLSFFLSLVGVSIPGIVGLIFLIIILLAFFVFYFGFVKLGKKTESKSLVFSSWAIIISILSVVILSIIAYFIIQPYLTVMQSALLSPDGAENIQTDSLMGVLGVLIIIFILIFLFFIVVNYIFYIALLKIKDIVKMARVAGIVGLITISASILFAFYIVYVATSGIFFQELLLAASGQMLGVFIFIQAAGIIINLLVLASLLFESLTLLEGSKRFE